MYEVSSCTHSHVTIVYADTPWYSDYDSFYLSKRFSSAQARSPVLVSVLVKAQNNNAAPRVRIATQIQQNVVTSCIYKRACGEQNTRSHKVSGRWDTDVPE